MESRLFFRSPSQRRQPKAEDSESPLTSFAKLVPCMLKAKLRRTFLLVSVQILVGMLKMITRQIVRLQWNILRQQRKLVRQRWKKD